MLIISFLMVSTIKYPAISGTQIWKKKPFFYLGTAIILIGVIFFFKELGIFAISFGYVLAGIYMRIRDFDVIKEYALKKERRTKKRHPFSQDIVEKHTEIKGE